MKSPGLVLIAASAGMFLAACQSYAADPAPATLNPADEPVIVSEGAPVTEDTKASCDILESRDWEAWINKMPGPDMQPAIHVVGKVDVRTGGYTFEWKEGPLDRSAVPALRLKLVPVKPDGMATMAITTEEVHYQAPALASGYSRVIIGCGDDVLAEITEIMDVY